MLSFNPSGFEQDLLESINRMRIDPAGELDVLFSSTSPNLIARDSQIQSAINFFDVNGALLLDQWAQLTAVPPIAWSEPLTTVAAGHNVVMRDNDLQEHTIPGEPPLGQRASDAGYDFRTILENVYAFGESPIHTHGGFVIDWGEDIGGIQDPPGHRDNIMDPRVFDVGIAVLAENDPSTEVGPFLITQDFGIPDVRGNPYLLGVAYADNNGNGIYNSGEGLGGVNITVSGSGGTFTTTTMSAGGYQLRVPAGTYEVVATGFSNGRTYASSTVAVGSDNVKVDFETRTANERPVAVSDQVALDEDSSIVIDVLSNDVDRDGSLNAHSIAIGAHPISGTVSVTNGRIRYTPNPNYFGADSFVYSVRDDQGARSNDARVSLTINDVAEPPTVRSVIAHTVQGRSVNIPMEPHITPTAAAIRWSGMEIVGHPTGGQVSWFNPSRRFQFMPSSGFSGTSSFTYRVPDVDGRTSDTATVSVIVEATGNALDAQADIVATLQDRAVTFDATLNDRDPNGPLTGATVSLVSQGDHGRATVSGANVTYTPDAGYFGRDTLTYRTRNSSGETSNVATATIYVTDASRPWQNPIDAVDVLPDGVIGPLDALAVINQLGETLADVVAPGVPQFLDTDGNNALGPVDALLVIGALPSTSARAQAAMYSSAGLPKDGTDMGADNRETIVFSITDADGIANGQRDDERETRRVELLDQLFAAERR